MIIPEQGDLLGNSYISTFNYLEKYIAADLADHLFFPTFYLINSNMALHDILHSTLTEKQTDFLMNRKLLDVIDEDSFSYTYIKDIFVTESHNIPLDDSVFLYSIFEFVNLYLYIYNPNYIIPTKNKKYNIDMLSKLGTIEGPEGSNFSQYVVFIGFKYLINSYKKTLKLGFTIYNNTFKFTLPIDKECNVLAHQVQYKVDNSNDFLFKVISIYEDIVGCILDEDLDLE